MNKSADTNGASAAKPAAAAAKPVRPRDARQNRFAQSFAQIVAVLMRDTGFRNMRIADLEWLVLPPIMAGQFRLAQIPAVPPKSAAEKAAAEKAGKADSKDKPGDQPGVLMPVAVALWARVSDKTDKALQNVDKQMQLHPADWASGDNIWLMAVAGDKRAIPKFLEQLCLTEFKDKQVKMRMRGADGKATVRTLGPAKTGAAKPAAKS